MAYQEFVSLIHKSTKRDYLARVTERDKAEVAELAIQYGYDYWDGSRKPDMAAIIMTVVGARSPTP